MKVTARRATRADLDAVLALDSVAPVGNPREELLTSRVESGEVLVVELDARLVAYAVVRSRAFFGFDFVELLSVAESHRRRGIASYLVGEAVSQSSTDRIFISTNQSNTPMIRLLENADWQFSGRLEGIDEGDPELVFFNGAK